MIKVAGLAPPLTIWPSAPLSPAKEKLLPSNSSVPLSTVSRPGLKAAALPAITVPASQASVEP